MKKLALILALLLITPLGLKAQPTGLGGLTDTTWNENTNPVQLWTTADGDSAWVHEGNQGFYWRAKVVNDGSWFFHHPDMGDSYVALTQLFADLDTLDNAITITIEEGDPIQIPEDSIMTRLQQIREYRSSLDSLLSTIPGDGPTFTYKEDCQTNVDNVTVHGSGNFMLPNGDNIALGDTIAAVTTRDNCAGYGVMKSEGFTMAVAQKNQEDYLPQNPGVNPEETFTFELYDKSEDKAYPVSPTFLDCEEVNVSICKDVNSFENDAFYQVNYFSTITQ